MSGDEEFDDKIEPQENREAFTFDATLFEMAEETKNIIEQEEKDGKTEGQVDPTRH